METSPGTAGPNPSQNQPANARDRFRTNYRSLSPSERDGIAEIKKAAQHLVSVLEVVYPTPEKMTGEKARYKALALTALEESVMWATKGMTAESSQ